MAVLAWSRNGKRTSCITDRAVWHGLALAWLCVVDKLERGRKFWSGGHQLFHCLDQSKFTWAWLTSSHMCNLPPRVELWDAFHILYSESFLSTGWKRCYWEKKCTPWPAKKRIIKIYLSPIKETHSSIQSFYGGVNGTFGLVMSSKSKTLTYKQNIL